MLIGVSGKTTHGTRIANVLDVIRIAAEWRKRGIIQIQIEDDEARSYDPQPPALVVRIALDLPRDRRKLARAATSEPPGPGTPPRGKPESTRGHPG